MQTKMENFNRITATIDRTFEAANATYAAMIVKDDSGNEELSFLEVPESLEDTIAAHIATPKDRVYDVTDTRILRAQGTEMEITFLTVFA